MIEPVTAWWVLFIFAVVSTCFGINGAVEKGDNIYTILVLLIQGFLLYCLYIIGGAV